MGYFYEHPRPAVTVDVLLLRATDKQFEVLLIRRKNPPFQNQWALPGGFIDMDEPLEKAARRELKEETGIDCTNLKRFRVYDEPGRDPRQRTITIVYTGTLHGSNQLARASDDAAEVAWFSLNALPDLAFDHGLIISDFIYFYNRDGE